MDKYVSAGSIRGTITPPSSKSYAQRAIALALLAEGRTTLRNLEFCKDTRSALRCIEALGAKVEVIKKKTMYAQNAQKLYECYVKYPSFDAIPAADRDRIEKKILRDSFDNIWAGTKDYFSRVDPSKIPQAERNPKLKMALVFRWYLGNSSRWAVKGDPDRKFDMQIWCGQSMGAFNLWVKGTPFEKRETEKASSKDDSEIWESDEGVSPEDNAEVWENEKDYSDESDKSLSFKDRVKSFLKHDGSKVA